MKHTAATKALAAMPVLVTGASMGMYDVGPAKMRVGAGTYVTRMHAYYGKWSMRLPNGPTVRSQITRYVAVPACLKN